MTHRTIGDIDPTIAGYEDQIKAYVSAKEFTMCRIIEALNHLKTIREIIEPG